MGESYTVFENGLVHTRAWSEKTCGKETTDAIFDFCERFNELELFDSEKAILVPFIMTNFSKYFTINFDNKITLTTTDFQIITKLEEKM